MKFFFSLILAAVFFQALILSQEPEQKTQNDKLIHLGDLIDVDILGSVEHDWRGTLTPEGFINGLDYIEEPVYALCKSEEEVAEMVAKGLSKLLRAPKVAVKILDRSNRPNSIIYGAVKSEQRLQIKRPVFLNEIIVLSGGFTEKASGEIQIYRPENLSCKSENLSSGAENKDLLTREKFVTTSQEKGKNYFNLKISDLLAGKANPQILSGDIITVLEAEPIYIIGGVGTPGKISSRSQTTLMRSIAAAGGLAKDADTANVTIFRRIGRETKIIEADYEKIKTEQVEDIILQAFDIVDVGVKGRGKSKFAPFIDVDEKSAKNSAELPLRIID